MKKWIFFLAAVGVIWLGSTWYIGRQVAPQIERYLQNVQTHFAASNGLTYRAKILRQGFFTSIVRIDLNASLPAYRKLLDTLPPESRHATLEIEHGPIFFRHGLGLGLARVTSSQRYAKYQKLLEGLDLDLHPAQGAIHTIATVSFDRKVHLRARGDALALQNTDGSPLTTRVAPYTIQADFDPETFVGACRMIFPSIKANKTNKARASQTGTSAQSDRPLLVARDLTMQCRIDAWEDRDLFLGRIDLNATHLRILTDPTGGRGDTIDLAPYAAFAVRSEGNGTVGVDYNSGFRLLAGTLPGAATLLTAGSETIHLGGLSQKGLLLFSAKMRHFQEEQMRLYNALLLDKSKPEKVAETLLALQELQQQMQKAMLLSLARILIPKHSTLDLTVRTSTRTSPDNQAHARLRLIGTLPQDNAQAIRQKLMRHAPELFALDANTSFGTTFLSAFGPQGIRLNAMLALALKQGWVSKAGGRYVSSLHYTPRELIINHTPRPQLLLMFKMLGGGGLK